MMKRNNVIRFLTITFIIVFALSGCGIARGIISRQISKIRSDMTEETEDNEIRNTTTLQESTTVSDNEVDVDVDIKEYLYENSVGNTFCLLALTNKSQLTIEIYGSGAAKDANGKTLATADFKINVLGPAETSLGFLYFDKTADVDHVDYQLDYYTQEIYEPVLSNLSIIENENPLNVTLQITNDGEISAEFVEAHAIFMDKNDNVVAYASHYVLDSDNEIKPGKTLSVQLDAYTEYDYVDVYLEGRCIGKESIGIDNNVAESNFDITTYLYESPVGSSEYFIIATNNSDENVVINGNAAAIDAAGKAIGAANMTIDVLAPGETSIGYFYFFDVAGIADVDYQLSFKTDPYFSPVLSALSFEEEINDDSVVVSVTNNGDGPADYVAAHVLFFDADHNVVSYDNSFTVDKDYELKPGETVSAQIYTFSIFDHVEVYLTGRAE